MFRRSFRKKKPKRDENYQEPSSTESSRTVNKLSNYSDALQLAEGLKTENRKLRLENEYLKHANNQSLSGNNFGSVQFSAGPRSTDNQANASADRPDNEVRVQQRIEELEDRLKEANEKLIQKDDEQKRMLLEMTDKLDATLRHLQKDEEKNALYDTLNRLENTLKRLEKDSDTIHRLDPALERLGNGNTLQRYDASLRRLEQHLSASTKRCEVMEESLTREIRNHSDLQIKISKAISNGQSGIQDIVSQIQELSRETNSTLTELLKLADAKAVSNANIEKLPLHLFGFALRIENEINTMDKSKNLGLALGLNPDSVEELANTEDDPKELFWRELHEWNHGSGEKHSLAVLIAASQKLGICPFQDGIMGPNHSKAIEISYSRLEADIFVGYVVSHLRDQGVLSAHDVDYILSPKTRRSQFRCLVDILPLFGEKAFDYFVDSLKKSGQKHLADVLLDELTKLTEDQRKPQTEETLKKGPKDDFKTEDSVTMLNLEAWTPDEYDLMDLDTKTLLVKLLATIITNVNHNKEMLTNLSSNENTLIKK
ncbi:uncharacterized protein LOC121375424 [Gigantopelta aegis]|uniref:uncharacterized protein LOC121375424 n=1 Tax=Gigantopelta aegis TaxID=1735272 RepID=UPI001B88C3C6|nr:uncharacterized protein LOC121375424 [Gigantopelta aegis]